MAEFVNRICTVTNNFLPDLDMFSPLEFQYDNVLLTQETFSQCGAHQVRTGEYFAFEFHLYNVESDGTRVEVVVSAADDTDSTKMYLYDECTDELLYTLDAVVWVGGGVYGRVVVSIVELEVDAGRYVFALTKTNEDATTTVHARGILEVLPEL